MENFAKLNFDFHVKLQIVRENSGPSTSSANQPPPYQSLRSSLNPQLGSENETQGRTLLLRHV
jgi:hypothetical protein